MSGSRRNDLELNVETIDAVTGESGTAPRPVALERAMKTVMAHEECWDEWLKILDPAAARALKTKSSSLSPFAPSGLPSASQLDGQDPAVGSNAEYCKPDQTIILFDWDDTLFPSNWLQQSEGFFRPLSESHAKLFLRLAEGLEAILKLAMGFGRVVIVTNSSEPWVSISVRTFMPFLEPLFKDIKVIYARALYENAPGTESASSIFGGAFGAYKARLAMQADALAPQRWKEQAFKHEIGGFYSRYENQSWKNVVCIGDSIYERDAAKHVVFGSARHCRLKTAKLMENPQAEDLIAELRVIHDALGLLVQYNGNLDVEIDASDLKQSLSLVNKILDPQLA